MMARWPVGRGETPRRDGACVHQWGALPGRGTYQCRRCQAQRAACPHDWAWLAQLRCWWCRLCNAAQPDARDG
jgi:hypothetical protein